MMFRKIEQDGLYTESSIVFSDRHDQLKERFHKVK